MSKLVASIFILFLAPVVGAQSYNYNGSIQDLEVTGLQGESFNISEFDSDSEDLEIYQSYLIEAEEFSSAKIFIDVKSISLQTNARSENLGLKGPDNIYHHGNGNLSKYSVTVFEPGEYHLVSGENAELGWNRDTGRCGYFMETSEDVRPVSNCDRALIYNYVFSFPVFHFLAFLGLIASFLGTYTILNYYITRKLNRLTENISKSDGISNNSDEFLEKLREANEQAYKDRPLKALKALISLKRIKNKNQ